ncbi:MAG: 5'/3'-nucleotidase SurE [Candidatus Verstraetearchaeota archaeon]|jgi:5'-nucleotidase|nr:5'/3'-nucleotidase SurE [Candidatus Verstraetearchaeota archaeon]
MKKPVALLVNDDGVHSAGIAALRGELSEDFKCFVVAPNRERSGIGKALTVGEVIRVEVLTTRHGEAYSISGTPADAVLLALHKLLDDKPDIVVAGINLGPNLGIDDILNSGTLGAAMEAAIHGIPSIAVSYCIAREFDDDVALQALNDPGLRLAARMARTLARMIIEEGMPEDVDVISINVPDYRNGIRGVRITRPSKKGYPDIHVVREGGYAIARWDLTLYPEDSEDTDVEAVRSGYVSLTPLNLSLTSRVQSTKHLEHFAEVLTALIVR